MKAPFDGYAIYEYQSAHDHWALVAFIHGDHVGSTGLKNLVMCGLEMVKGLPRSFYYQKDCSVPLTIEA